MADIQEVNNGYVFDYVLDLIRKEKEGNTISIPRFNRYLYSCMLEFMEDEYNKWEINQEISDSLSRVRSEASVNIDAAGDGSLTITYASGLKYFHLINAWITVSPSLEVRPIVSILTKREYLDRVSSSLLFPTSSYPICYVKNVTEPTASADGEVFFRAAPFSLLKIDVEYLHIPKQPFFDYYIDSNDNIIYLPEGDIHTWTTGETDSDGNARTTGDPDYASKSIELVFGNQDVMQIVYRILVKLGVNVKNSEAAQLGLRQEQKEESA